MRLLRQIALGWALLGAAAHASAAPAPMKRAAPQSAPSRAAPQNAPSKAKPDGVQVEKVQVERLGKSPELPPAPRTGSGVVELVTSPTADSVVVDPVKPVDPEQPRYTATATPARFELPPGKYRVSLASGGTRYAYDLNVDVKPRQEQRLEVELRSSGGERAAPLVFAGLGAGAAGGLAYICSQGTTKACAGAAGAAALTALVSYAAYYAWSHDGRIVKTELAQVR